MQIPNVLKHVFIKAIHNISSNRGQHLSCSVFATCLLLVLVAAVADLAAGMRCALWKGKCMVMLPASHPWPLRLATDGFGANAAADE